jgi:hypothetical protein
MDDNGFREGESCERSVHVESVGDGSCRTSMSGTVNGFAVVPNVRRSVIGASLLRIGGENDRSSARSVS